MTHILIVDDEANIRRVVREYAEFEGYKVTEAENGMEAVNLCRENDYDLIIMDIMMPRLDGYSACKEIHKVKQIPVIMLSARGEEYDKLFGFEIGIDDYVTKPFSPKELMARIKDDVDTLCGGLGYIGMLMIELTFHICLVMYNMLTLSPKLSVLPILFIPVVGALAIILEKKLDKVYSDISEENAKLNTVAQENLAGVRTVKAFAREKFEIGKFLSHNKRYYELNMKQSKILIRYQPVFQFVTKFLPVVTILFGGRMVINGEITLGTLGAFIAYCDYIVWPMEMLGWVGNEEGKSPPSQR